MKTIVTGLLLGLLTASISFAETWLPNYGYYENSNEITAKDRFIGNVKNIYDFETSPNLGGEELEKGRYYVPVKYQGGYNGIDTDYIYADELKGDKGADGAQGQKGDTGATGAKGEKGNQGDRGADGRDADIGAIHDLQETRITGRLEIRLYDHKRFSISIYDTYDFRHRHNHELGFVGTIKLGKSYEERKIEALEKQIEEMQTTLGLIGKFREVK